MHLPIMESLEVSNLIVVESQNDKFFIEAFINKLNLKHIEVGTPICSIDEYECLSGMGNLTMRLKEIKFDNYKKIGIILDADNEGTNNRLEFINNCLKTICNDIDIRKINKLEKSKELDIEIACYVMNIADRGELETVLKAIKSVDSTFADCLDSWRSCLKKKNKNISDKDFDKFWINNYLRFDTCSKSEQKQAGIKCNNEAAMKKNIWDFDSPILDDLKKFIQLF